MDLESPRDNSNHSDIGCALSTEKRSEKNTVYSIVSVDWERPYFHGTQH